MRQRFSQEISQEIVSRSTSEKLRRRLASEGHAPDGMATSEMLNMATLEIRSSERGGSPPPRRRRLPGLLLALVLVAVAGAYLLGRPGLFSGSAAGDAGVTATDAGAAPEPARVGEPVPVAGDAGPGDGTAGGPADETARYGAEHRVRQRYGFLDINSRPWSRVWLDGKRVPGETPIFKLRVRAGQHRLRFFNPKLNIEKTRTVKVPADETIPVIVDLTAQ